MPFARPVRALVLALPLAGCRGCDAEGSLDAELEVVPDDDTPTALATWTADDDVRTRVEVEGDDRTVVGDWSPAGAGEVKLRLLGLRPDADWTATLLTEDGSRSEPVSFTTAALPIDFPGLTIEGTAGWSGWILTSVIADDAWAVLFDQDGQVSWFARGVADKQPIRTSMRRDRVGVYVGTEIIQGGAAEGEIDSYDWGGDLIEAFDLPHFTHEFHEFEDGSFVWVEDDCREIEGEAETCGDRIMTGAPAGGGTERWSTFDSYDPVEDGDPPETGDWTHANAMRVDEEAGILWLGFRGLDAIVAFDLETYEIIEQIGGPQSDYNFEKGERPIDQHQFQWLDDGSLLLHDNRKADVGSRVMRLAFDGAEVSVVEEFQHNPPLWDYILGDVDRDAEGNTLVTWSVGGVMEDFDADNQSLWTMSLEFGNAFAYTERFDSLPGVTVEPAL
jgi:hypothetical protein